MKIGEFQERFSSHTHPPISTACSTEQAGKAFSKMGTAKKEAARKERQGKTTGGMSNVKVKGENFYRSAKKVKVLNIRKDPGPQRNATGNITKAAAYQSREAPKARIEPNRKWFGNTRVIAQDALNSFREAMAERASDPYQVLLKTNKLPMSLIRDGQGMNGLKQHQAKMTVESAPFVDTFGPKAQRKRVKLGVSSLEDLAGETSKNHDTYLDRLEEIKLLSGNSIIEEKAGEDTVQEEGHVSTAREAIFSKGQSKRIWNELYKVIDSSDVVIHVLDARDPLGTRCRSVEKYLREEAPHKHLIFVLNKCDLVPTKVAVSSFYSFSSFVAPFAIVKSRRPLHYCNLSMEGIVCYNFGRLTPCSPLLASGLE